MMKNRWLLNLGLLLAVAALATLIALDPGQDKTPEAHLTAVDSSGIATLTLKNKDTITFEKRDGRWWIATPFAAPANEFRVNELLGIAKTTSYAHYPITSEQLAEFELDQPKAELTVGGVVMQFGGSDPLESRRYVKVGDTLHLVQDDFYHHLIAAAADFVERKLLPDNPKLKELQLPGFKVRFADGHWVWDPANDQYGPADQFVEEWRNARAIEVRRLEPSKTPPGPVVRVVTEGSGTVEFAIAQREPDLMLVRSDWGLQYQIVGESGKKLLTPPPKAEPAKDKPDPQATPNPADAAPLPGDAADTPDDSEPTDAEEAD